MERRKRASCARVGALLVTAFLLGCPPATGDPKPRARPIVSDDPLGYAPDGEWPMQDGSPARTRATRTRLPAGELEAVWTYEAPAPIAGEPVVVNGRVFVGTWRDDKSISWLDVLRLSDGKPLVPRRKHDHGLPIVPTAWRDIVFVPASDMEAEALRVVPESKKLASLGTFPAEGELLLVDGDVVGISQGRLWRRRAGSPTAIWVTALRGRPLGPPSARYDLVFVVTTKPEEGYKGTQSSVEVFDLTTGTPQGRCELGWDAELTGESRIVVAPSEVYIRHGVGVRLKDQPSAKGIRIPLNRHEILVRTAIDYLDLEVAPVVWGPDTIARATDDKGELVLFKSDPDRGPSTADANAWRWQILATPTRHAELLAVSGPPVVAAGIALLSGGSFEVGPGRLLDVRDTPATAVRIPVKDTLLEVTRDKIVAWRSKRRPPSAIGGPALPSAADAPPLALPAAAVVTLDGAVRAGDLAFTAAEGVVVLAKEKLPRNEVGLVVDRDGKLVHGPDPAFVARHLRDTVAARSRAEWLALAKRAVATRSEPVLREALDDLLLRGGGRVEDLKALRIELTRLEKPVGAPPKVVEKKVEEVRAERARLLALEDRALELAVAALPDATPLAYRAPLFRTLLAKDPAHPATSAWLRARLPAGFEPGKEAAPSEWLDILQATAQSALQLLPPKAEGAGLSLDDRAYGSLRTLWRKDIVALRSDRLFLVTPVSKPSRIARCLSLGELVCSTLDALFEVKPDEARLIDPLVIQLFETRDEYLAWSSRNKHFSEAGRTRLEYTAGHYDPGEGISRLFVPPGDDRFDGVMETLAHELTHHWLDQRMPVPKGAPRTSYGNDSPGYFLEEGFATMVEELVYDLDARTHSTDNPRADSLDIVASAPQLLSWDALVEISPNSFTGLPHANDLKVPTQWTLGRHRLLSETNLFYSQSGAICHYLWNADGGKHRATLRQWVRDLHAGKLKPGETERRLGMTPAQLGAAVTAWARQVSTPRR